LDYFVKSKNNVDDLVTDEYLKKILKDLKLLLFLIMIYMNYWMI
jgi:hypothetical protein